MSILEDLALKQKGHRERGW